MFPLRRAKNVQQRLENYIDQHQLIDKSDKLAIAVSGGKDSVAAAHLFNNLKRSFVIVHCNFKLRAEQSDGDEKFVIELGEKLEYCSAVYNTSFDTQDYCLQHKLSIQEAARKLRYDYFQSLYNKGVFSKLITAHHQSDQLETFFINLYRGSGIKGLAGIPIQRSYIIRPMMAFNSDEISDYIDTNKIEFREDESNASNKYLRNKIRNQLLPKINQDLPNFSTRVESSLDALKSGSDLLMYLADLQRDTLIKSDVESGFFKLELSEIDNYPHRAVFLFYLLDKYGFSLNQCEQILASDKTGATFYSTDFKAVINRGQLLIGNKTTQDLNLYIQGIGEYLVDTYKLTLTSTSKADFNADPFNEIVDMSSIEFPLNLRNWQEGDFIQALGMEGKKLLSDFMIDNKLSVLEKSRLKVLAKGKEVFWIIGHRISDKWKITDSTQEYCKLAFRQT